MVLPWKKAFAQREFVAWIREADGWSEVFVRFLLRSLNVSVSAGDAQREFGDPAAVSVAG